MTVIITQPPAQPISAVSYRNNTSPKDKSTLVYWGTQHTWVPSRNRWHGLMTGLKPPRDNQLATYPWLPCSTGVHGAGNEIGIILQSWSLRRDLPPRRGLGTIVLQHNPTAKIYLLADGRTAAVYSFDMKVPSSFTTGGGVSQVVAYFSLVDSRNKRSFWLGLNCFDSRGTQGADAVLWDIGTKQPIVRCFAGTASRLGGDTAGPHKSRTFSNYQSYRWSVTRSGIESAAQMLRAYNPNVPFSDDAGEYYIGSINLNPEIYVPTGLLSYAHIGLAVRNWQLELI
jgi:hypothetical protein